MTKFLLAFLLFYKKYRQKSIYSPSELSLVEKIKIEFNKLTLFKIEWHFLLAFIFFVLYNKIMEKDYSKIIARNLTELRKAHNLTQSDIAEKLNYTDKSVSKWEQGAITPSIEVLCQLAKLFGTTLEDLLNEDYCIEPREMKRKEINRAVITCLAISIVWMLASVIFVYATITWSISVWMAFVWAVPLSCVIALVFNSIWGSPKIGYWIISVLIWSLLISIFLQFMSHSLWPIFLLGIPGQISVILWSKLK